MNDVDFIKFCKEEIVKYVNNHLDKTDAINKISINDVYIGKILQNNKALVSTTLPDGMYYEITYNGDKNEVYIDAYKKWDNICIKLD